MKKRVKIGGIGKSPAIEKINAVHKLDVKMLVTSKMEELVCIEKEISVDENNGAELRKIMSINVPLKFD